MVAVDPVLFGQGNMQDSHHILIELAGHCRVQSVLSSRLWIYRNGRRTPTSPQRPATHGHGAPFMILFTPIGPNPNFRRIYKTLGVLPPPIMGLFTPLGRRSANLGMGIICCD
jgi:hypothetical protein